MHRNSTRRGFTLIELLVVVVIIAVLAAIALPQYQKAVKKSRAAEAKLTVKAIWDAQMRKNLEMGTHNKAYNFEDLDISFTDKDGNAATGTFFYTKDFYYGVHIIGNPTSSIKLVLVASPANYSRNGNYELEINNLSDGKFVCWANSNTNDCSIVLSGATEVDYTHCSSGNHCYVE